MEQRQNIVSDNWFETYLTLLRDPERGDIEIPPRLERYFWSRINPEVRSMAETLSRGHGEVVVWPTPTEHTLYLACPSCRDDSEKKERFEKNFRIWALPGFNSDQPTSPILWCGCIRCRIQYGFIRLQATSNEDAVSEPEVLEVLPLFPDRFNAQYGSGVACGSQSIVQSVFLNGRLVGLFSWESKGKGRDPVDRRRCRKNFNPRIAMHERCCVSENVVGNKRAILQALSAALRALPEQWRNCYGNPLSEVTGFKPGNRAHWIDNLNIDTFTMED